MVPTLNLSLIPLLAYQCQFAQLHRSHAPYCTAQLSVFIIIFEKNKARLKLLFES
jgi:hypothetical protein